MISTLTFSIAIPHFFSLFSLADSGWSVEGVTTERTTVSGGQSTVQCSSSHLTSFAVLVDVRGAKVGNEEHLSEDILFFIFTAD